MSQTIAPRQLSSLAQRPCNVYGISSKSTSLPEAYMVYKGNRRTVFSYDADDYSVDYICVDEADRPCDP